MNLPGDFWHVKQRLNMDFFVTLTYNPFTNNVIDTSRFSPRKGKKEDILPGMIKWGLEYTQKELCKVAFKNYETPMEMEMETEMEMEMGQVFSFLAILMLNYTIFPKILVTQKAEIHEDVYMPYFYIYQPQHLGSRLNLCNTGMH